MLIADEEKLCDIMFHQNLRESLLLMLIIRDATFPTMWSHLLRYLFLKRAMPVQVMMIPVVKKFSRV